MPTNDNIYYIDTLRFMCILFHSYILCLGAVTINPFKMLYGQRESSSGESVST